MEGVSAVSWSSVSNMSLGTGVFLSAILVAIVTLYAVTKDRWNWKRIVISCAISTIALATILVVGVFTFDRWDSKARPQQSFAEIALDATPADVKFIKGEPTSTNGPDRWIFATGPGPATQGSEQYLIQFKDGRLRFIAYTADESQFITQSVLGFTIGSRYQDVEEKLGPPSHIDYSIDELDRVYSYDQLNVFFSFKRGCVFALGLYQPADGPMKFRTASSASAPNP